MCFGVLLAVLSLAPAHAQDWAKARLEKSPRHLEWVTVQAGDRKVKTFVAYPEVKHKAPAVVIIHEIFGLSDWVRQMADELAERGYVAVAPDLLSGKGLNSEGTDGFLSQDAVRKAISTLPPEQITSDLNAVVDYAAKLPASNGKVVVAGFCWGGGEAFRFATNNNQIKAAFVFYGPPPDSSKFSTISAPVYGFYAGNDARVNDTVSDTERLMHRAHKKYEANFYSNSGHGFMRAGEAPDAKPADKRAREQAWKDWLARLKAI